MTEGSRDGIKEREWTDKFGTQYEVRAVGRNGRIFSQVVTRTLCGWPPEREQAFGNVKAARAR